MILIRKEKKNFHLSRKNEEGTHNFVRQINKPRTEAWVKQTERTYQG